MMLGLAVFSTLGGCDGSEGTGDTDGDVAQWLGLPCDPSAAVAPEGSSVLAASDDPGCGGEAACLFAVEVGAASCTRDEDCPAGLTAELQCVDERCVPAESTVAARSMCAPSCDEDAQCETMNDTACASGFVCSYLVTTGPDCCTKMCVCSDDLNLAVSDDVAAACAAGTQEGCSS